eukprot:TRINITY_DN12662_c0_g1_i4.p1 TRINITY_DN12662_c0_g1~~TRINITY_DN12662_c0_g1_i4.p1  ORF type:complete len:315 (+),score=99.39 TRINITY_DN12662_c0_g1_i4:111-947(+)
MPIPEDGVVSDDGALSPWASESEDDNDEAIVEYKCFACPSWSMCEVAEQCSQQSFGRVKKSSRHSEARVRNNVFKHLLNSSSHDNLDEDTKKQMAMNAEISERLVERSERSSERRAWQKEKAKRARKQAEQQQVAKRPRKQPGGGGGSGGSASNAAAAGSASHAVVQAVNAATAQLQKAAARFDRMEAVGLAGDDVPVDEGTLRLLPNRALSQAEHVHPVTVNLGDLQYVKDQLDRSVLSMNSASRAMVDAVKSVQTHCKMVQEVTEALQSVITDNRR